jgi:hypothetical protein
MKREIKPPTEKPLKELPNKSQRFVWFSYCRGCCRFGLAGNKRSETTVRGKVRHQLINI